MFTSSPSTIPSSQFIQVGIPLPLPSLFTYIVPVNLANEVHIGSRVLVPFGKKRIYTGFVFSLIDRPSDTFERYEIKEIIDILDDQPVFHDHQIKLYEWIADYCMASVGEVLKVAIPSGLKLSSESLIQINPELTREEWENALLDDRQYLIMDSLSREQILKYSDVQGLVGIKTVLSIIKPLVKERYVYLLEQVKEKYSPKKVKKILLNPNYLYSEDKFQQLFHELEKKPKQLEILLKFIQLQPDSSLPENSLNKSELVGSQLSLSALKTLIKNEVFKEVEVIEPRVSFHLEEKTEPLVLSDEQKKVYHQIQEQFKLKNTVLFWGVTGSGKTEVYIKLIEDTLSQGGQALYLLPEIAITVQIVSRLQKHFGSKLAVYHSKYSDNERVEVWNGVFVGQYQVIVAVRSGVFLPFENLKLIIVDEEHEGTFKQQEPSPKYHARNVSVMMTRVYGAKCLLGSATPSLESWYNAKTDKYGFVELKVRHGRAQLPDFQIIDTSKLKSNKSLSDELTKAITLSLTDNDQILIFQNRRGYAPFMICESCGETTKCINCSVSLTYHHRDKEMKCHYCGYRESVPNECHNCGSSQVKLMGFGTEKLEEELELIFPDKNIKRMDFDTTRRKLGYDKLINSFAAGEIDILVGTQMITKGLDFNKVNLVGVVEIDRLINFPDFRSSERAFQALVQVGGRAGRRDKKGKVIVQTAKPTDPVILNATQNKLEEFYNLELTQRHSYRYPPFVHIIKINFKSIDQVLTGEVAELYLELLRKEIDSSKVIGPVKPIVERVRNMFLVEGIIKLEKKEMTDHALKDILMILVRKVLTNQRFKKVSIRFDVDPY